MSQPSQTRLVNDALVLLGSTQRISAMNEATPLGTIFATIFNEVRDDMLVAHPWNFALHRASLAVSADYVPPNEYLYAYEKPSDLLRWLPWRADHEDYFLGEEEDRYLLTNAEAPIQIRYIRRVNEVSRWSASFRKLISAELAYRTAKAVTGQTSMMDRAERKRDDVLRTAKREDGLATGDRRRRAEYRSSWLDAREGNWNGR